MTAETGLSAPEPPKDPEHPQKKHRDWHDVTSIIMLGCTFAAAFGAACFTARQAYLANKQLRVARDSLAVTQDIEERQLRAYMLPEKAWLSNIDDDRPVYEFHAKNYGQTPARHVTVWAGWRYFPVNNIQIPSRPNIDISDYIIGPQGFTVHSDQIFLDANRKKQIREGQSVFFLLGDIRYIDVFGNKRTCDFRFVWKKGFEPSTTGALMVDTDGNDCD